MNNLHFFIKDDGSPWAAFVVGHVDLNGFFEPSEVYRKAAEFRLEPEDLGDLPPAQYFYIRRSELKRNCDFWNACGPDAPGAVAVTGMVFN